MKLTNKIAVVGAVILMITTIFSCNEDFLDKNPLDQISSQAFWNNETDVNSAVAGCYARLKGGFLDFKRGYLDGLSENAYVYWGMYGINDVALGNISPTNGGPRGYVYYYSYLAIAQCNFVMDNIDNATTVDQSKLNMAKGEVRFIRALNYFELVNCFGDVILYRETPKNADESKIAKSPKADVLKFIEEDLDFAIANLPDNSYTSGHAVKGSAMALKTRVLLTEEKWLEAATLSKQIIDGGKFSLYGDYPNMFLNKGQVNNPEIMFSCQYLGPTDVQSEYGMNIEYAKHIFLRKELEAAFDCKDGLSISESPLYDPNNIFKNRDPRHSYTVRNPKAVWKDHYAYDFFDVTGVQNRKYIDTTMAGNYSSTYLQDWDFILLRYADVLLMYAEAKNEASGPDQSVYNAINQVRARAGVNMPPVNQARYNSKELVREFIRHERQVEFAMEGIRYFDLKRWHIADIVMPKIKTPEGNSCIFLEKHYYWPFSQGELDSNPNLKQTTGY